MRAIFRARFLWLCRTSSPRERTMLRFLPALFHARFPTVGFDGDPIGLSDMRSRILWGRYARMLDLPAPNAVARASTKVQSLWVVPSADGQMEVLVGLAEAVGDSERERVVRQVRAMSERIEQLGFAWRFRVGLFSDLAADDELLTRMSLFGAIVHGPVPVRWTTVSPPSLGPASCLGLAEKAPTAVAGLGLLLGARVLAQHPLVVLRDALGERFRASALGLPELGIALWLGRAQLDASSLVRAVAWGHASASARFAARTLLPVEDAQLEPALWHEDARRLTQAAVASVRAMPRELRAGAQALYRREVARHGFPRALLPALRSQLGGSATNWVARETLGGVELLSSTGFLLARARTEELAWCRAVALAAAASGKSPFPASVDGVWRAVGERAALGVAQRTLLLGIRVGERFGLPSDPLNRGEGRELSLEDSVCVWLRPVGRPRASLLAAASVLPMVLRAAVTGGDLDLLPESADALPMVSRLRRIFALAQRAARADETFITEAGGVLYQARPHSVVRRSLRRHAVRPERALWDVEAPDLGVGPTPTSRETWPRAGEVTAFVSVLDERAARIVYTGAQGYKFWERVPFASLEAHLADGQELLRGGHEPARLLLQASPEVEERVRRAGSSFQSELAQVELHGDLPFGVGCKVGDELFGGKSPLGWKAAAQTILAGWPPGSAGRVRVQKMSVWAAGSEVHGLLRLYVRSLALRRLWAHLGWAAAA